MSQECYSAKSYFSFPDRFNDDAPNEIGYEQRITLLKAENESVAMSVAENEAREYAAKVSACYLGFTEIFPLFDGCIDFEGIKEVYSITFYDDPNEGEFLNNYYLTGGNFSFVRKSEGVIP